MNTWKLVIGHCQHGNEADRRFHEVAYYRIYPESYSFSRSPDCSVVVVGLPTSCRTVASAYCPDAGRSCFR